MIDALDKAFAEADSMVANCKSAALSVPAMLTSGVFPQRTLSISEAQEMLLHFRGWVWSAVRLVAQRIAAQPVCVGKKPTRRRIKASSIGEKIEPLESHPLLDALSDPNEIQTFYQLMFASIASLEITGRFLWWIQKGSRPASDGSTIRILPIPTPWIVSVDPLQTSWKIRPRGSAEDFTIPGDEILNVHYADPADPRGVISPLSRISEAVLTDQNIQTAQHSAFNNGLMPKIILTAGRLPGAAGVPGERPVLSVDQREELFAMFRRYYAGALAADTPFIVDGLIESVQKLSNTVAEMDFLNSGKVTKSRILQAYGVSPILLGEIEGANRASSVVADEIFVGNKINPLIELISGSMSEYLGPMFAGPREKLVIWIEPACAHDPELNLKRWDLGLKMGAATRNEYRVQVLNLQPLPGADVLLEPAGFLPSEQADDNDDQTDDDSNGDDKPEKRLNGHYRLAATN
jgi:HK97 family phage portal protein